MAARATRQSHDTESLSGAVPRQHAATRRSSVRVDASCRRKLEVVRRRTTRSMETRTDGSRAPSDSSASEGEFPSAGRPVSDDSYGLPARGNVPGVPSLLRSFLPSFLPHPTFRRIGSGFLLALRRETVAPHRAGSARRADGVARRAFARGSAPSASEFTRTSGIEKSRIDLRRLTLT